MGFVPFENFAGDVINSVGYEKRGQDVYGIMQMSHEDDDSEKHSRQSENYTQIFFIPKNQSHEEWQSCVGGEKQVVSGREFVYPHCRIRGDGDLIRKRRDMCQCDKNGPDDDKQSDAFQDERYFVRFKKNQHRDKKPQNQRSVYEYGVDVVDGHIVQHYVRHRIAGCFFCIDHRVEIQNKTCKQQNKPQQYGKNKGFIRKICFVAFTYGFHLVHIL